MKIILGESLSQLDIGSIAPVANVGMDMKSFREASRPKRHLVTVTITVAPSDVTIWGAIPKGVIDDSTDDAWGKFIDEYGTFAAGKLGTALATGVYHFVITGLGLFSRVYFQKSAGTVDVVLSEILEAGRGN